MDEMDDGPEVGDIILVVCVGSTGFVVRLFVLYDLMTLSVKMKFFEGQSRWLKKDRI